MTRDSRDEMKGRERAAGKAGRQAGRHSVREWESDIL